MLQRILTLLVVALLSWSGAGLAAENAELAAVRRTFQEEKKEVLVPVLSGYVEELEKLESNLLRTNDRESFQVARAEKNQALEEMARLRATELVEVSTTQTPLAAGMPKFNREPKIYVDNTKGIAGAPDFSKNNVYTFKLNEIGNQSSVIFYASGRNSVDSYGKVWLVTPKREKLKIYKWSPRDFNRPFTEATSFDKLDPVVCDISEFVNMPGTYKVEFEYTDGIDALGIMRVELTS